MGFIPAPTCLRIRTFTRYLEMLPFFGRKKVKMAGETGLEPATCGFGDRCSPILSYSPAEASRIRSALIGLFSGFPMERVPALCGAEFFLLQS